VNTTGSYFTLFNFKIDDIFAMTTYIREEWETIVRSGEQGIYKKSLDLNLVLEKNQLVKVDK